MYICEYFSTTYLCSGKWLFFLLLCNLIQDDANVASLYMYGPLRIVKYSLVNCALRITSVYSYIGPQQEQNKKACMHHSISLWSPFLLDTSVV